MSRYEEIRFKGIVKKEFREDFTMIALEGKWKESKVEKLRDFGTMYVNACDIPMSDYKGNYVVERWNKEHWAKKYDKNTGEWKFQIGVNTNNNPCMLLDWEEDMIPFLMESVEHYEFWPEPIGDDPYTDTTVLLQLINGKLDAVGFFEKDETYVAYE